MDDLLRDADRAGLEQNYVGDQLKERKHRHPLIGQSQGTGELRPRFIPPLFPPTRVLIKDQESRVPLVF